MIEKYENEEISIFAAYPRDPIDIIWYNLGGEFGFYFLRKYCWNLLGVFLIIFISTPAVIFQTIKSLSLDIIPFIDNYPDYITTAIVLTINLVLLVLIDRAVVAERHSTYSRYHSSIFSKAYVYLHLNMVIFPFLGLQEQPIYKILKSKTYSKEYIKEFNMLDSAPFFVNLLLQYGVFSAAFYLLRVGELAMFSFSPKLVDYMRNKFNTLQSWRRTPDLTFQYGYFYCQMVVVFTIVILFSSTSPMVVLMGVFYYFMRNMVDSHSLMSINKKEIHSGVNFFQRVSSLILVSLCYYQICMLLYFYFNELDLHVYLNAFIL